MKVLLTNEEILKRTEELANQISNDLFLDEDIIVAPILKGGLVFGANLFSHLDFPCKLEYFHTSRYRDEEYGTGLVINPPDCNLVDKTVLLIDDIYDEGVTLDSLVKYCHENGAKKVVTAVLLDKNKRSKSPKYVGFSIPNHFVYGFGLDRKGFDRNLPFIAYDEVKGE